MTKDEPDQVALGFMVAQIIMLFAKEFALPAALMALKQGRRPEDLTPQDLYWPAREALEAEIRARMAQTPEDPRQMTIEDVEHAVPPRERIEPIPPRDLEGH